jgi:hypothetical protein
MSWDLAEFEGIQFPKLRHKAGYILHSQSKIYDNFFVILQQVLATAFQILRKLAPLYFEFSPMAIHPTQHLVSRVFLKNK